MCVYKCIMHKTPGLLLYCLQLPSILLLRLIDMKLPRVCIIISDAIAWNFRNYMPMDRQYHLSIYVNPCDLVSASVANAIENAKEKRERERDT